MFSEVKNMSEVTLTGVITEIIDNGNMGEINCGSGNKYTFSADQLAEGYSPILKDIVKFELIEDSPFNIRLFHRAQGMSDDSAAVDLRVTCPHCHEKIIPKAKVQDGHVTATFCPKCQKELEKFDRPPKVNVWNWLLAILCALLIASAVYFFVTQ